VIATRLREGIGAGIVGGVVSAAWGLLMSPILGTDLVRETRLAAGPLLGVAALGPGNAPLALVVGGASHMLVSIAWGVVFALTCGGRSPGKLLLAGVPFGIFVWIAMFHGVLPLLGAAWVVAGFSAARAMTEHVVYGLGVALGLLLMRSR
jgi:hypothetical protein